MKIVERYIGKSILGSLLMIMVLLIGIEFIFTFINEIDNVGEGVYTYALATQHVLMTVPRRIYEYFVVMSFLAGLLGVARLASSNELVALRVAGVSVYQILFSCLKVALVLVIFVAILGETLAPKLEREAEILREQSRHPDRPIHTGQGIWLRHKDAFIHIKQIVDQTNLSGIAIYQFDENMRLHTMRHAKSAHLVGEDWQLVDIVSQNVAETGTNMTKHATMTLTGWIEPELLEVFAIESVQLSTTELVRYIDYLEDNQLDTSEFELALWKKLLQPIAVGVMVLLAIPLVFGPLRSMNLALNIFLGGLVGFSYFVLNDIFGQVGLLYNVPPALAASLPTLVFAGIGFYFIRRVR